MATSAKGKMDEERAHHAALRCPFKLGPQEQDLLSEAQTSSNKIYFLKIGEDGALWGGYYANYRGSKLAVSWYEGVWFEIERDRTTFRATRIVRDGLGITHSPRSGIDMDALRASGEPIPRSRAPSISTSDIAQAAAATHPGDSNLQRLLAAAAVRSSDTERGRGPPRHPRGTGDDPVTLADLKEERPVKYERMEGTPPTKYDSDRAKTRLFLSNFSRFMMMNRRTHLAKDPFKKSAYFLGLLEGPKVDAWVIRKNEWLAETERHPEVLPFNMTAWDVLEQEFRRAFTNYAEQERARDELQKLRMRDGNVDEFVAAFENLGGLANMDLDDPAALRLFARGLPCALAEECIKRDSPSNFRDYSALQQQRNQNSNRQNNGRWSWN